MFRRSVLLPSTVVSIALLAGCSGGGLGSSGGVPTVSVRFSIAWAERTRATGAPASALSAIVILSGARPDGTDFSFTVTRLADPAAYSQDYVSPPGARPGTWDLAVNFMAQADGMGSIVATGRAGITLNQDGSGIGDVTTLGTIRSLEIPVGQTVNVGQKRDIVFSGRDSSGRLIGITPGSASFAIVSGGDRARVNNGQIEGLAVGSASVSVTVEGMTSAPETVSVISPGTIGPYDIAEIGSGTGSTVAAINSSGQAVGMADTAGAPFPYLWNGATASNLTPMMGVSDISDSGQIAGSMRFLGTVRHAVIRQGLVLTQLGTLPNGGRSDPAAINGSGWVVGSAGLPRGSDGAVHEHAFLWKQGILTDLGTLPGKTNSRATDINDQEIVVGVSYNNDADARGFQWQKGSMIDIGPVDLADGLHINGLAQVVGTSPAEAGQKVALLFQNAQRIYLTFVPGLVSSGATGINDHGLVVGYTNFNGSAPIPTVFKDGGSANLISLLSPGSDWSLRTAVAINNNGQIAGTGIRGSQMVRAYLLTPK